MELRCVLFCVCVFFSRVDYLLSFFCLLKPVKYCILMVAGLVEEWYFFKMDVRMFFNRLMSVTDTFIKKNVMKRNKTWFLNGWIICNLITQKVTLRAIIMSNKHSVLNRKRTKPLMNLRSCPYYKSFRIYFIYIRYQDT